MTGVEASSAVARHLRSICLQAENDVKCAGKRYWEEFEDDDAKLALVQAEEGLDRIRRMRQHFNVLKEMGTPR